MKNIAIFVSGTGSNAKRIIDYFDQSTEVKVALLLSNKPDAPALAMAAERGVDTRLLKRKAFYESEEILDILSTYKIDFVVLAGFLWLIPPYLVQAFRGKMVNVHPALLPAFGGKNMYGAHVHKAVHAEGRKRSGMTIHWVNENYDEGDILFQASTSIAPGDSPEMIAKKVLRLEHSWYPAVIERLLGIRKTYQL